MDIFTIDTETYFNKDYTLKKLSTSEYIFDGRFGVLGVGVKRNDEPSRYFEDAEGALKVLKPFLEKSAVLAHHAHFDGLILSHCFNIRPYLYLDTLSMARGLGLPNLSLEKLVEHFELGKKTALHENSTREQLSIRARTDCDLTYSLFRCLAKGYPKEELALIDLTIRWFTDPTFVLDRQKTQALIESLKKEKADLLEDLGVEKEVLSSNPQFVELLESLGVDVPLKKNPKGKTVPALAKNDPGLISLLDHDDPKVQAIVAARLGVKSTGDQSRAERYLSTWEKGACLPVYLSYYGAHTGRWSGGDKTNYQNLKRNGALREALLAPKGKVFVVGDQAQIEARLTAYLAGQRDLLEVFADSRRDPYCEFGTELYERTITRKDVTERFISKACVLGLGFGLGHKKLRGVLRGKGYEVSEAFAERAVTKWRKKNGRIVRLWKVIQGMLGNEGTVPGIPVKFEKESILLPNGMRIRYPGLAYNAIDQQWSFKTRKGRQDIWGGYVTENIVQALARIIIGKQMLELQKRGFKIVTSTHDEIVVLDKDFGGTSVDRNVCITAAFHMHEVMLMKPDWCADLPLAVEIGEGRSYGEAK